MIDKRLKAVADFIKINSVVCDVGTDHAYLPCFLIKENIAKKVIATDINNNPLQAAKKHIESCHFEDRIQLRLSDGLRDISEGEVTTIVIAGMGGELIFKILSDVKLTYDKNLSIILQPMTQIGFLREKLYKSGFYIKKETPVIDGNHFYTVMSVGFCGENKQISDIFYYAGCFFDYSDDDSLKYLNYCLKRLNKIIDGQEKGNQITDETKKMICVTKMLKEKLYGKS